MNLLCVFMPAGNRYEFRNKNTPRESASMLIKMRKDYPVPRTAVKVRIIGVF